MAPVEMQRHRTRGSKFRKGFSALTGCFFSIARIGRAARKEAKSAKCLFCDPERMSAACNSAKGRSNITKALKAFRAEYDQYRHVYNAAILRVPDEWREKFHTQALKQKQSLPKRQAPVAQHAESAAKQWKTALESRKRAFKDVGSKEVTAYKKRRTADRNRVEKKFFVDHDLPKLQAEDIAPNDAGLPRAATSSQAAFVEQWCKFGSWAICKQCHSLQPRPLEPVDTRRVAGAEMTATVQRQALGAPA